MPRTLIASVTLCLAAAVVVRADVTIQYVYDVKAGPGIPAQAAAAMQAQLHQMTQSGVRMQLKGNRAVSNVMGIVFISDFDGQMISLVDAKQAKYATVQKDEYLQASTNYSQAQMAKIPEAARKQMDQLAMDVKTELTGKTISIHGIEAEERQITISVGSPGKPGSMRMVIATWTPTESEMARNPMMRELKLFTQRAYEGTSPGTAAQKLFGQSPGFAGATKFIDVLKDSPVLLRMRTSMYLPPGTIPGAADGPLMETTMDAKELSAAEIPNSVFEIPRDYSVVSIHEALSGVFSQFKPPAVKPAASEPARR